MPPNQVTLVYNLNVGLQSTNVGSKAFQKAADINWDPNGDTASYLGMDLDGLSQTPGPNNTIVIQMVYTLTQQGKLNWPTADMLKTATRNLFGRIFEHLMPALVTAEEPVVS